MQDETLILYYYEDGLSEGARAEVAAALEQDATLRERYRALQASLEAIDELPLPRAPAHLEARWHESIAGAAAPRVPEQRSPPRAAATGSREADHPPRWHLPSFAWGALAAALVAALGIGLYLTGPPPPVQPVVEPGSSTSRPDAVHTAFSRGLETHLRRTRESIGQLDPQEADDRAGLIMDIVRQNRMFERTAHEQDAEDLARVLRAFEPVLLRLADEETAPEDTTALTAKLEFELDVLLTKMQRRDSHTVESI